MPPTMAPTTTPMPTSPRTSFPTGDLDLERSSVGHAALQSGDRLGDAAVMLVVATRLINTGCAAAAARRPVRLADQPRPARSAALIASPLRVNQARCGGRGRRCPGSSTRRSRAPRAARPSRTSSYIQSWLAAHARRAAGSAGARPARRRRRGPAAGAAPGRRRSSGVSAGRRSGAHSRAVAGHVPQRVARARPGRSRSARRPGRRGTRRCPGWGRCA